MYTLSLYCGCGQGGTPFFMIVSFSLNYTSNFVITGHFSGSCIASVFIIPYAYLYLSLCVLIAHISFAC